MLWIFILGVLIVGNEIELSPDDVIHAAFHRPLVEILHPENGQVLENSDLEIIIGTDDYIMPSKFREAKICIGMNAIKNVPDGIKSTVIEQCFDQSESTTFKATGLVAGASYLLRVLLVDRGNVVAVSVRNFRVAAISIQSKNVTIQTALQAAVSHHQNEQLQQAADIYSQILEENPNHQDALHLMGLILYQGGNPQGAIPYIQRAINNNSTFQHFHNSLGLCLRAIGNVREAVSQFEMALTIQEDFLAATFNLGLSWQQLNQWERASAYYTKVLSDSLAQDQLLTTDDQETALDAQIRLCDLLQGQNQWKAALTCLVNGLKRWPANPQLMHEKGNVELHTGDVHHALESFQAAAEVGMVVAMLNVASVYQIMGETGKSFDAFNRVLAVVKEQGSPFGHILLMRATVLPRVLPATQQQIDDAISDYNHRVSELLPIIEEHQDITEPLTLGFSTGFYLAPDNHVHKHIKQKLAHMYSTYCPALLDGQFLGEENVILQSQLVAYEKSLEYSYEHRLKLPRIKVGFISRFFYTHTIGVLLHKMIQKLNRRKFEVFVFSILPKEDDPIAEELERNVEHYVVLPEKLRICHEKILKHHLDVLVYAEIGIDPLSYFLSFARLASVQAAWYGHPETTGIPTIDYFLTTEFEDKVSQQHYTEQIFPMRGMGLYVEETQSPPEEPLNEQKHVLAAKLSIPKFFHMYICTEPLINLHPDFDDILNRILRSDRLAHIFFFSTTQRRYWDDQLLARFQQNIHNEEFLSRIHILHDLKDNEVMNLLQIADVALSPVYFNNPLSVLNALSVGLPVVTMPGLLLRTRFALGFYQQMDIMDCIAYSVQAYVNVALKLVLNDGFRNFIRRRIRENISLLFNDLAALAEWERFFMESVSKFILDKHGPRHKSIE